MKTLSNFEQIAKKNKRKNWLKTVLLSTLLTLAVTGGVYYLLEKKTSSNGEKMMENYLTLSEIAYPNIDYISWGYETTSNFSGQFYSNRMKDIDGILVPFEKYTASYSISRTYNINQDESLNLLDGGRSHYTYGNHYKVPIFYGTKNSEEGNLQVTKDIDFVPKLTGQAVEVAITFDKAYTLAEIEKKIPDNLKLNWIWIGKVKEYDLGNGLDSQFGFAPNPRALSDKEQKKLDDEVNQALKEDANADVSAIYDTYYKDRQQDSLAVLENNYMIFQDNAQKYIDAGYGFTSTTGDDGKTYSTDQYLKDYLEANQDPKTATFAGVILTGRAENFAQLENADWIYASNIGQSVQIQPYHQLEK